MGRRETALKYFREMSENSRQRMTSGVELYRKGDARLTVTHADGSPLAEEATVHAVLKNHEFRFGANIFMLDEFESEEKNADDLLCQKRQLSRKFSIWQLSPFTGAIWNRKKVSHDMRRTLPEYIAVLHRISVCSIVWKKGSNPSATV